MKVVFVHDHKFRRINGQIYSPGGLSNEVLSRYVHFFDMVTVIGRIIDEKQTKSNYSLISNPCVNIATKEELQNSIQAADAVIVRLPSINGYKAVHFAKKYKRPYLTEVVGCTFDAYWNYGVKGKLFAVPAFLLMRYCVSKSSHVVYVTKQFLEKRYPTKGKYVAISDVELKELNSEVLNKRLIKIKEKKDKLVLGTTASVDVPYKGHEFVIRAIPQIEKICGKQVEYQMAGAGDRSRLMRIAESVGVTDKIIFKGSIPHEQVFDWLDNLDIYIQPSMLEGLSRALVEAMSRGLPCIATEKGGNPELVEKKCLVSIANRKNISRLIAGKIDYLLKANHMSEIAERNYSISKEYDKDFLDKIRFNFYSEFRIYTENEKMKDV